MAYFRLIGVAVSFLGITFLQGTTAWGDLVGPQHDAQISVALDGLIFPPPVPESDSSSDAFTDPIDIFLQVTSGGIDGGSNKARGDVNVTSTAAGDSVGQAIFETQLEMAGSGLARVENLWQFSFNSGTTGGKLQVDYLFQLGPFTTTPVTYEYGFWQTPQARAAITGDNGTLFAVPVELGPNENWTLELYGMHQINSGSARGTGTFEWSFTPAPVPEPSSLVLLCGAFAAAATFRGIRRRRHALRPEGATTT